MTKRSDINKQVSRRGGGYPKTGKGTSLKKINKERGQWEMLPGTGTSPYNPPKWRKKKKTKAKVKATTKPRTYQENPSEALRPGLQNKAIRDEIRRQTAEQRARARVAATPKVIRQRPVDPMAELPAIKSRGGKVNKKYNTGGKVVYGNHHGGNLVADLYKEK
jgi:hypothetical protein